MALLKLYHCSNDRYDVLRPGQGPSRHDGEDDGAVGVPVVWFSTDPSSVQADAAGVVSTYQHEVEIDSDDPDLCLDQKFDELMAQGAALFGGPSSAQWYYLKRSIEVTQVRVWDEGATRYV